MPVSKVAASLALACLVLGHLTATGDSPTQSVPTVVVKYRLSGPYSYQNLSIYLVHGADQVKNKNYLTLKEALEQKKVIVHETGNVNQLTIENVTGHEEIFVQAGDIVKGGNQDRVIAVDLIVPPKSGKLPLSAFCVEAGRWTRRGSEDAAAFRTSNAQAPTKDLKFAVRAEMAQNKVWENVAKAQSQLSGNLGQSVQSSESASSLQLTLEAKKLQESVADYVRELGRCVDSKADVIGYVAAINGNLNCADIYATHSLFTKIWPTLIQGSAVEALSELKPDKTFAPPTRAAVAAFLLDPGKEKASNQDVSKRIRIVKQETRTNILFECRDRANQDTPIRRSYIIK
jgi:hypothetical protein